MSTGKPGEKVIGLKRSPWNLVLLIPLLILVTPLYNFVEPRLFGLPFYYWAQLAFVVVGVLSVWVVYIKTRNIDGHKVPREDLPKTDLDEGEQL